MSGPAWLYYLVLLIRPALERDDVPLTGGGEELGHGHDGEAHEGIGFSNFLSLIPHLEQNLTAALGNFTEIKIEK